MKTAVEWYNQEVLDLLIKLQKGKISNINYIKAYNKTFNKAKEMEKEQIMDAHYIGYIDCRSRNMRTEEQYYKETFKSE